MEWLNIAAGIITVITGVLAIMQYIKQTKKPPILPSTTGSSDKDSNSVKVKPSKIQAVQVPAVAAPSVAGVQVFSGNDDAYQKWVQSHPQGFVVNTNTKINPEYMPLHKATCGHISNFDAREKGAFTERDFIKVCSTEIDLLKEWVKVHGRPDGSFTGKCPCAAS